MQYWKNWNWSEKLDKVDWAKNIKKHSYSPHSLPLQVPSKLYLVQTPAGLDKILGMVRDSEFFGFDTEASGLNIFMSDFQVAGLCFAFNIEEGFYIPIHHKSPDCAFADGLFHKVTSYPFNLFDEQEVVDKLHNVGFETKGLIGHNIKYDLHVMRRMGLKHSGPIMDTMLASQVQDPYRLNGLKPRTLDCFGYTPEEVDWKTLPNGFCSTDPRKSYSYASADPVNTLRLAYFIIEDNKKNDTMKVCDTVEFPLIPKLVQVESFGVSLDPGLLESYSQLLAPYVEKLEIELNKQAGIEFKPASNEEKFNLIYRYLRVPYPDGKEPERKGATDSKQMHAILVCIKEIKHHLTALQKQIKATKPGELGVSQLFTKTVDWLRKARVQVSIDRYAMVTQERIDKLSALVEETLHMFPHMEIMISMLSSFNKLGKLKSSFVDSLPNMISDIDRRVHTEFRQVLNSGRQAGRKPNLMQLPRDSKYTVVFPDRDSTELEVDVRAAILPPPGYKFVCVAGNERVVTNKGPKNLKDIKVWDKVCSKYGQYKYVNRTESKGIQDTLILTTNDGYSVEVTPTHNMKVVDLNGDVVDRQAQHIKSTDHLILQFADELPVFPAVFGPIVQEHFNNKYVKPAKASSELAELAGIVTGDGGYDNSSIRIELCNEDTDCIAHTIASMYNLFTLNTSTSKHRGSTTLTTYSKPLRDWFKDELLVNKNNIPDWVWQKNYAGAYLRGLFDTDGTVGRQSVSVKMKQESLAKDTQQLLLLMGIPSRRKMYITKLNDKEFEGWRVNVRGVYLEKFQEEIGFISNRKKKQLLRLVTEGSRKSHFDYIPTSYGRIKTAYSGHPDNDYLYKELRNCNTRKLTRCKAMQLAGTHPIWARDAGVLDLLVSNAFFDTLASTEHSEAEVYDISVPGPTAYVAGGFYLKNCNDWDAMEMKMCAAVSGCPTLIDVVTGKDPLGRDYDAHLKTAELMGLLGNFTYLEAYDIYKSEDGSKDYKYISKQRQDVKPIGFGLIYGISEFGLSIQLECSVERAKELMTLYFSVYKGVKRWLDNCYTTSERRKYASTGLGRRRNVPEEAYTDDNLLKHFLRACANHEIQGSCADIAKYCEIQVIDALKGRDIFFCNFIHDEMVLAAKDNPDDIKYAAMVLETCMQKIYNNVLFTCESEVKETLSKNAPNLIHEPGYSMSEDEKELYRNQIAKKLELPLDEMTSLPW